MTLLFLEDPYIIPPDPPNVIEVIPAEKKPMKCPLCGGELEAIGYVTAGELFFPVQENGAVDFNKPSYFEGAIKVTDHLRCMACGHYTERDPRRLENHMCYDDQRVEALGPIVATIPTEALKLIAQSHTSEINLRCACLDELCLRDDKELEEAIEERNWAERYQDQCEKKDDVWWHFDEYITHICHRIDRLKDEAVLSLDPSMPIDNRIREINRIEDL